MPTGKLWRTPQRKRVECISAIQCDSLSGNQGRLQRTLQHTGYYKFADCKRARAGWHHWPSYSYLFGPVLFQSNGKYTPFAHALFGQNNVGTSLSHVTGLGISGLTASDTAFAMAFGGGVDIKISERIAVRVGQVDYFYTKHDFSGGAPGIANHQNNLRASVGIVFQFGATHVEAQPRAQKAHPTAAVSIPVALFLAPTPLAEAHSTIRRAAGATGFLRDRARQGCDQRSGRHPDVTSQRRDPAGQGALGYRSAMLALGLPHRAQRAPACDTPRRRPRAFRVTVSALLRHRLQPVTTGSRYEGCDQSQGSGRACALRLEVDPAADAAAPRRGDSVPGQLPRLHREGTGDFSRGRPADRQRVA